MSRALALVDCNNFYASCEKVFNPALKRVPVVVLSNNDGCIIARSAEAKAMGVPMGAPYFKCRAMLERAGTRVFSSNYALYGDMSARVMRTLAEFTPELEVYSIDEAFLDLTRLPESPVDTGLRLRRTVLRHTGIPVSVGIGPTKTLAKIANRLAKKTPGSSGVWDVRDPAEAARALRATEVEDVWGIGRKHARRLRARGVVTAWDFSRLDRDWVKKHMTVVGLQILLELRGQPCHGLERGEANKKSIVSSRSFGSPVTRLDHLREALSCYVTRAAEKLRRQGSVASHVLVFLQTNKFHKGAPQYSNAEGQALEAGTCHTPELIGAALRTLERIFRPGYSYKKCGVMLSGIEPENGRQLSLLRLPPDHRPAERPLMSTLDRLNARWGRDTVYFASTGTKGQDGKERPWAMRRELRSPRYTTAWTELPVVRA